jgi:hypothetical protein
LGPYENSCKIFKSKALKIYVSHRLAGMGEGATLAIKAKDDEGDGHARPVNLYTDIRSSVILAGGLIDSNYGRVG